MEPPCLSALLYAGQLVILTFYLAMATSSWTECCNSYLTITCKLIYLTELDNNKYQLINEFYFMLHCILGIGLWYELY